MQCRYYLKKGVYFSIQFLYIHRAHILDLNEIITLFLYVRMQNETTIYKVLIYRDETIHNMFPNYTFEFL